MKKKKKYERNDDLNSDLGKCLRMNVCQDILFVYVFCLFLFSAVIILSSCIGLLLIK